MHLSNNVTRISIEDIDKVCRTALPGATDATDPGAAALRADIAGRSRRLTIFGFGGAVRHDAGGERARARSGGELPGADQRVVREPQALSRFRSRARRGRQREAALLGSIATAAL